MRGYAGVRRQRPSRRLGSIEVDQHEILFAPERDEAAVGADAGAAGDGPHRERTRRTRLPPESPDQRALVAGADTDDVRGTVVGEGAVGPRGPDRHEGLSVAGQ